MALELGTSGARSRADRTYEYVHQDTDLTDM